MCYHRTLLGCEQCSNVIVVILSHSLKMKQQKKKKKSSLITASDFMECCQWRSIFGGLLVIQLMILAFYICVWLDLTIFMKNNLTNHGIRILDAVSQHGVVLSVVACRQDGLKLHVLSSGPLHGPPLRSSLCLVRWPKSSTSKRQKVQSFWTQKWKNGPKVHEVNKLIKGFLYNISGFNFNIISVSLLTCLFFNF